MGLESVVTSNVKPDSDLVHPDDAQYIWLPIAALVGIFILAALVYAMSRSRCQCSCPCLKRIKTPRIDYIPINVEDEDSDVPMAGGDEFGEQYAATSLLAGRLHIENVRMAEHMAVWNN
ncbi:uncharacterized protein LOC111065439 [Drosophila obscura]|uniref:uncharacterized protein LOC111065439 n=1 Tax=Drosophila obscura TaxID=7282 RepID=UPI001BB2B8D5|nr:uncharacterized protein LOC111065439 [Drosophila obscura]